MKKVKEIGVDMDDVIADFYKSAAHPISGEVQDEKMFDRYFFLNLEPIPGAKSAVFQLLKMGFNITIVSQPFTALPESYMEKAQWIQLHFPQLTNKIILTQDKGLVRTDFLIDDNKKKWQEKFEQTGGKFIHFQYGGYNTQDMKNPEYMWTEIVEYFKTVNPYKD